MAMSGGLITVDGKIMQEIISTGLGRCLIISRLEVCVNKVK